MLRVKSIVAIALAAVVIPVFAQSAATPGIDKRQANQEKRIQQGVDSGALTGKEANRLENREAKIEKDKVAAQADGKVTAAERRKLTREQNHASRAIHREKHDAQTK